MRGGDSVRIFACQTVSQLQLQRMPSCDLQVIVVERESTEAISYLTDHKEIAALTAGARNDEKVIATQPVRGYDDTIEVITT